MTAPFTVVLGDGPQAERHRIVLATLPNRFRVVEEGEADAALVTSGMGLGRVAVLDGAALLQPPPAVSAVPALSFLPRLQADPNFVSLGHIDFPLIDALTMIRRADARDVRMALTEQVAAVFSLTGAAVEINHFRRNATGYLAEAKLAGRVTTVTLAGVRSPLGRSSFTLDAVGAATRLQVSLDDDAQARSASISLYDQQGLRAAQPIHQNGLRLVWVKVAELLSGIGVPDASFAAAHQSIGGLTL